MHTYLKSEMEPPCMWGVGPQWSGTLIWAMWLNQHWMRLQVSHWGIPQLYFQVKPNAHYTTKAFIYKSFGFQSQSKSFNFIILPDCSLFSHRLAHESQFSTCHQTTWRKVYHCFERCGQQFDVFVVAQSTRIALLATFYSSFVDDFIYKREPLSCSVCLAYGGCLLLFGLLSHTFKKHHYSLLLILTVSEFLYISFHSCPIPLSLTSYLILSPFSPSFSSPFSPSPACPP